MTVAVPDDIDEATTASAKASKILIHHTPGEPPPFPNAGRIRTEQNGLYIQIQVPPPFVLISDITVSELEAALTDVVTGFVSVELG